jgi:hypothetical protein
MEVGGVNEQSMSNKSEKIVALNDAQRRLLMGVMCTSAVDALPPIERAELLLSLREYDDFDPGNDPYEEHDFGTLVMDGQRYFFKIDYYSLDLMDHSPNPSDEAVTRRVITLMRADEY